MSVTAPDVTAPSKQVSRLFDEAMGGALGAVVLIVYAVAYSAAVFSGAASDAVPEALWGFLIGAAVGTLIYGARTSMPPLAIGADSIAVAMLIPIVASIAGAVAAAGGSAAAAGANALAITLVCTCAFALFALLVGSLGWGAHVRFVPFAVIEGFWLATGVFIMIGAVKVVAGVAPTLAMLRDGDPHLLNVEMASTIAAASLFFSVQRFVRRPSALPLLFFGGAALLDFALWRAGPAFYHDWFVTGADRIEPVIGSAILLNSQVDWTLIAGQLPNIVTFAVVTLVSVLVKTASIESQRACVADLDREFSAHGLANVALSLAGGFAQAILVGATTALTRTGGRTRVATAVAAVIVGVVAVSRVDVLSVIPAPVIGGFLLFLGYDFFAGAAGRVWSQGTVVDRILAAVIAIASVWKGFFVGISIGVLAATVIFAINYRNLGVVRRHVTRAGITSHFDRSPDDMERLRENGYAIHLFWLAGYVFFGSAHAIVEAVNEASKGKGRLRFVVLDLMAVEGLDTAALMTFVRLGRLCRERGVVLAFAQVAPVLRAKLDTAKLFEPQSGHRLFERREDALVWCENQLLETLRGSSEDLSDADFQHWLAQELTQPGLIDFMTRRRVPAGTRVYAEAAPSDSIDLVAAGTLAITTQGRDGKTITLRRMARRTVIGEMGLFRALPRAANVDAESDVLLYTLKRSDLDRLARERPELALAFNRFIIRTLANRVDAANREIASLA